MTGKLSLVSVGPGFAEHITPSATKALKESEAIVGYELYLNWIKPWIAGKEVYSAPLTHERERAMKAIELARAGRNVSLISSGDIGVYAMASLAFEELNDSESFDVKVIPGITAANACSSLLGSPLSHDFATLSLSDLLCPWSWIEERATRLAEADMCIALYNVQSEKRQDGIYKIVRILLEHKPETTVCGVVRNAYRPDQSVSIGILTDLLDEKFDMFTTILVGNRYTVRKGNFIFTPRGYNGWFKSEGLHASRSENVNGGEGKAIVAQVPSNAIWIFSGTSDGNRLANELVGSSASDIVLSVATEYGAELASSTCPGLTVVSGSMGAADRGQLFHESKARCVVDATHPYAEQISRQLVNLCQNQNIPYIRYERPSSEIDSDLTVCESPEEAATIARQIGKRIFLSTGSKDVRRFVGTTMDDGYEWFIRIVPDKGNLESVLEAGIPRDRICAMQGPFSQAFNESLWREWNIDCVITKESGRAGGFEQKVEAAKKLGIPLIVLKRPILQYPRSANSFDEVQKFIRELGGASEEKIADNHH